MEKHPNALQINIARTLKSQDKKTHQARGVSGEKASKDYFSYALGKWPFTIKSLEIGIS